MKDHTIGGSCVAREVVRWLNTTGAWRLPWLLVLRTDVGFASFTTSQA